jgi:hypothetical protein
LKWMLSRIETLKRSFAARLHNNLELKMQNALMRTMMILMMMCCCARVFHFFELYSKNVTNRFSF